MIDFANEKIGCIGSIEHSERMFLTDYSLNNLSSYL
jgi:hypothetical protein